MALMTAAQTTAELQRKKNANETPTDKANVTAYNKLTAQPMSASTANSNVNQYGGIGNGNYGPPSGGSIPQTTPTTGTTTKTDKSFVPFISGTADPITGGNTTEYREQRAGDTGVGVTPPTPVTPVITEIAKPMSASLAQPAPDYAALAAARTSLALQQKTTIANQQKTAAQTAYDQQNLRTKDDRVLGDFSRTQTASAFKSMGRTSFQEGLIGRERTQADADASTALATQKGNIDALLADYQNATADEQVRIADELQRADRQYNLDLAKFNQDQSNYDKSFNYNSGQDAIKNGQTQQQIDYSQNPNNPNNVGQNLQNQLAQYQLADYPAESKARATLLQQQVKSGALSQEAAEYNLKLLMDPNSPMNQSAALDLQIKSLEAKNLPEKLRLELQGLKKSNAQIGVVHYKPQTATEIATDAANLKILQYKADNLGKPESTTPKSTDYKLDPKFAEDIAYIKANPAAASMLDTEAQKFIDAYGYDGYVAMRKSAGLADPVAP